MSVNININGSQLVIGSQPEVTAICLRLTTEQIKKLCSIGTIARNKSDGFLSYAGVPYNFVIHGRSQLLLVCSYLHFYLYSKNTSYYLYSKNTSYYLYSNNTSYYLYSYITLLRNTPKNHTALLLYREPQKTVQLSLLLYRESWEPQKTIQL